jgi:hypothetical protein
MVMKDLLGSIRKFDVETLYNTFVGLPPQQQTMALAGGVVTLLLIFILPISIASSQLGGMEEDLQRMQERIDMIVDDIERYASMQGTMKTLERKFKGQTAESLLTVIQRIAKEVDVEAQRPAERGRDSLEYYDEEKASFHVKNVSLEQVVQLIHKIESSKQRIMRVKEMTIYPVYGNRSQLNAEFKEVAAYRFAAEAK